MSDAESSDKNIIKTSDTKETPLTENVLSSSVSSLSS